MQLQVLAGAHPARLGVVEQGETELVFKPSSAAAASAAGVLALMRHPHNDNTSQLVLHSLFELATGSVNHGIADPPPEQVAPSLFRAKQFRNVRTTSRGRGIALKE
jgi:hypothetical protein